MIRRFIASVLLILFVLAQSGSRISAQETDPHIRVVVNLVQLNVAVTDDKGNYITGLRPQDFAISEDGITQKVATFGEGAESVRRLVDPADANKKPEEPAANAPANNGPEGPQTLGSLVAGANVFILFDTSNYMYRGFVFAQDAIADFVRSLESANRIAFYSYSRDLSRGAPLTSDRTKVLRAVRTTVAGDEAALYNTLLLTLKDAAQYTGRRVVVVFSNGPDNSSVVPPEDVAELAQSAGVSIYMISTQQAKLEPVSTAVFDRMTSATGGKAYFAKSWKDEQQAFASIRDDLAHLYSLTYYPKANPNSGLRSVSIRLMGDQLKKYKVRTRSGYRPLPSRFSGNRAAISESLPGPVAAPSAAEQTPS